MGTPSCRTVAYDIDDYSDAYPTHENSPDILSARKEEFGDGAESRKVTTELLERLR